MSTTPGQKSADAPVRILQVVGGMDRGGVETWLMHVLRHLDRDLFQMDFAVNVQHRCAYDEEIEALGSHIYPCPNHSHPIQYARNFRHILRRHGSYDVVHSHVHHYSGFVLRLAAKQGVPIRIAHSHTDTRLLDNQSSFLRRFYLRTSEKWIARYATSKLATSIFAAESLFGPSWATLPEASILYCGIDLKPFAAPSQRTATRATLNLAPDAFVLGHVGRFVPLKNHKFLLRVHQELLKLEPKANLLLIGQGPLEDEIRAEARSLGLLPSVRILGARNDIPRLMLDAMDSFVLPSTYEGLGLVAIEAQAAGLPTVLSSTIPPEANLGGGLVQSLSLEVPPQDWALLILNHARKVPLGARRDALAHARRSPFSIEHSVADLCHAYQPAFPPPYLSNATAQSQPNR